MSVNVYTYEYVHYELEFDLNNLHVLIKEEVWKLMVPDISKHVEEATPALRYLFLGSYFLRTIHNFLENKKEEDIFTITSKFMFFINKKVQCIEILEFESP